MRSVALSVVLVILLAVGAGPVAATTVAGTDSGSLAPAHAVTTPVGTGQYALQPTDVGQTTAFQTERALRPSTTFTINLQSDRSAEWVVTVEYELTNEVEREAFTDIATAYEDGTASSGLDVSLYENIAALASEQTGRTMEIQNVVRSSSLRGDVGTLELSFTWTGFLQADDERLIFNDSLRTPEDDSWLTSLSENQELRITTPRGYAITSANVGFADNTVVITGPHTFDSEELIQITLEPSSFTGPSWELLGAAVVIASAIIGGALLLRRQDEEVDEPPRMDANGGVDTAEAADDESADDTADDPAEPEEDLSLLADDERVLRLLERNGGRMRQAEIVSETNWSDAKVSQQLSAMADEDQIEKLRIGRENLISLPDVDAFDGSRDTDDE